MWSAPCLGQRRFVPHAARRLGLVAAPPLVRGHSADLGFDELKSLSEANGLGEKDAFGSGLFRCQKNACHLSPLEPPIDAQDEECPIVLRQALSEGSDSSLELRSQKRGRIRPDAICELGEHFPGAERHVAFALPMR